MKRLRNPLFLLSLFFSSFLRQQRLWGWLRLFGLLFLGLGLGILWGTALESQSLSILAEKLKRDVPLVDWLPTPFLLFLLVPSQWSSLRFLLVPLLAFGLGFLLSARYFQDAYHLSSLRPALRYLLACLFGIGYPTLSIGKPEEEKKPAKPSYLPEVGGPGYLMVSAGYVAVVSSPQGSLKIYTAGDHFLLPGEKVEETFDLSDQTDSIDTVSALCYEGVAIQMSDVHFGYRLWQTPPPERAFTSGNDRKTGSLSSQPLRNLLQSRVVTEQGLSEWRTTVKGMIRSVISDFIYRHSVNELLKPPANYNPYADLKRTFYSRAFRSRLRKMGTELLWINLGLFDFEKETHKKLLKLWQTQTPPTEHPMAGTSQIEDGLQTAEASGHTRAHLIETILHTLDQPLPPEELIAQVRLLLMPLTSPSTAAKPHAD